MNFTQDLNVKMPKILSRMNEILGKAAQRIFKKRTHDAFQVVAWLADRPRKARGFLDNLVQYKF
jgi:hypothetical protein